MKKVNVSDGYNPSYDISLEEFEDHLRNTNFYDIKYVTYYDYDTRKIFTICKLVTVGEFNINPYIKESLYEFLKSFNFAYDRKILIRPNSHLYSVNPNECVMSNLRLVE